MVEANWQEVGSGDDPGSMVGGLANAVAACLSLALIAGLLAWGYELWKRDVTGIPVIRAMEGPMRVAPADPGGTRAPHQGLAVNAVTAGAGTDSPAEKVALAPEAPALDLTEMRGTPRDDSADADTGSAMAADEAVDDAPAASAAPEADAPKARDVASDGPAAIELAIAEAMGVSTGDIVGAEAGVPDAGETQAGDVAPGSHLVQLGSFKSEEDARWEWERLDRRFDGALGGHGRVVQKTGPADRTFWRLRATGFQDIAEARAFCATFTARSSPCIPVVAD